MNVSIIGAGNVATQLALALRKAGHTMVQVYNRSNDAGEELARTVGASFTSNLSQLAEADIYLISVKDDAIAEIAAGLQLKDKFVAHTSGTKSRNLLKDVTVNNGVFYPLQTMTRKAVLDFKKIPFLIEGSNNATTLALEGLAASLSEKIHIVDEEQRQWIHVAAVFANNFTNHLYGISEHLLAEHGLPFDILKPLIFKAIENLERYSPSELQTGPAARQDMLVIDRHLQLLADESRLKKIYEVLTESIISSLPQNKHI
ncbi:MAG: F420-dependent NADP oxidoreductase [Chitinophagales bacterium]